MSAPPAIRLENVSLARDGRTILDGLDLAVASHGITAMIGPNGAGKSMALRVIDGLIPPDSGTVRLGAGRRAFVFQQPALVRTSARANVALGLIAQGLSRHARAERAEAALARVGLSERAGDAATRFSGGERQRLALARAWAMRPDLLLLDEPTASLDPAATETIETLISEMAQAGTAVLVVSHNLGQVARLADDVVVLTAGRAVERGSTRSVLFSPRTAEARAYLTGEMPWTSFAAAS